MVPVTVIVLATLLTSCFCSTPLYEAKHYKVFSFEDRQSRSENVQERREVQFGTPEDLRTIIETPTNGTVPTDNGSPLFGDMMFTITRKDGELIIRDTIVNQITDQNVLIYYNRTVPGYYIEDMRIYNVGRERGSARWAHIAHIAGFVETEIAVAAYNTIRMFVEIYVRIENEKDINVV